MEGHCEQAQDPCLRVKGLFQSYSNYFWPVTLNRGPTKNNQDGIVVCSVGYMTKYEVNVKLYHRAGRISAPTRYCFADIDLPLGYSRTKVSLMRLHNTAG